MTLKINGATGGSVSLDAPDNTSPAGTDVTLTLPVNDGDAGQYLQTDGTGTLSWQTVPPFPDAIDVNASAPADSVNIDSSGRFLVGTATPLNSNNQGLSVHFSAVPLSGGVGGVEFYNSSTSTNSAINPVLVIYKGLNDTTSSNRFVQFYANVDQTPMGGIVGNGASNVQFASLSDIRDKENIAPVSGSLEKVKQLEVVSYDWKTNGEHVKAGFIAQNVETVLPEYVVENMSNAGQEARKGVTGGMSSGYVAVLTAALQEAVAKIETLETRLTALEGGAA